MPPKSVLTSKVTSGVSTPRKDDDVLDVEFTSPLFSALLQDRLRQLDLSRVNSSDGNIASTEKSHKFNKNSLVHSIEVLSEDRRKTSELAREQALGALLRHLVMKYDPAVIHYELFHTIVQAFTTARTEVESVTALQLICVSVTMIEDSNDARSGDSFDLVTQLQQSLPKRMENESNAALKQAMITTYAVLTYFLNAGGGGYGMESAVGKLMELAESISGPENASVAAAALSGAALLTTLTSKGAANEIAEDWLFSLVPMLDMSHITARLATVKFIAVLFERADPEVWKKGDNQEACDEIIRTLESISQESVARTAKKDKRIQNLLIRSVLKSCQYILSDDESSNAEKSDVAELVSHYHRHTMSRSLGITSWAALTVVEHLTWVFGPGIHSQLANNPYIKSLLAKEDLHVASSAPVDDDENEGGSQHSFHDDPTSKADAAKRSRDLRKQQLEKVEKQGRV